MSIVRFEPFRDLTAFQDRVNRLFTDLYSGREEGVLSTWVPAVDIYEDDKKALVLKAELPDVNKEDVSVTVENNTLSLSGERKLESEVNKDRYHRIERAYGRFSRSFSLPTTVDAGQIAAEFKNGVLTIRLPFREEARPRTIDVAVS